MASTSTINTWVTDLAQSIIPHSQSRSRLPIRKSTELFRRRVRNPVFPRTNQFEVTERLDGLEEKFVVLDRDDLADALHKLRAELREHDDKWLPDILDLFLELSCDPLSQDARVDLQPFEPKSTEQPILKWADIEADDPFDHNDPIWATARYSDLSSDQDEVESSTAATSPRNAKSSSVISKNKLELGKLQLFDEPDLEVALDEKSLPRITNSIANGKALTEIQLTRETLLMLQGYPTASYKDTLAGPRLRPQVTLLDVDRGVVHQLTERLTVIRKRINLVQAWLEEDSIVEFIQAIKQEFERIIQRYVADIDDITRSVLRPQGQTVISLLAVVETVVEMAHTVLHLADYVDRVRHTDAMGCMDELYKTICRLRLCGDDIGNQCLLPIFIQTFKLYVKPLSTWLNTGKLESTTQQFFVQFQIPNMVTSRLWHDWFEPIEDGFARPPNFLLACTTDIFICGKTSAFLNLVTAQAGLAASEGEDHGIPIDRINIVASDPFIPFHAVFTDTISSHVSEILRKQTVSLKMQLDSVCGFRALLDAFEYIYLSKDGTVIDSIESKLFKRIDGCVNTWNDRFMVAAMLEESYKAIGCIDPESLTVQSLHTSSRSMQSRRKSVKILGALSIQYSLPWPIANIISADSMASLRQIALHLAQIRRAKYVLERIAYPRLQQHAISDDQRDQSFAQILTFMLLQFVNASYDHFTTGIITPMTARMRQSLKAAHTVDAMIEVHQKYIDQLEYSCLTTKNLKVLRDTFIALLDMCIRFADLVSSPATASAGRKGSDDFEASSFMSALSRRRRRRRRGRGQNDVVSDYSSSEEDDTETDDEGDGYTSFIVLDDDTSIIQEIRKLSVQFRRQLDFFVAGLRGVGRGGEAVEEFEILAARMDWKRVNVRR